MRVKARSKKPLFMIAAFALVVALSIGLTSAFLTAKTGGLTNTFTPANIYAEVQEIFEGTTKSDVKVYNGYTDKNKQHDSDAPVYIRVALVPTWKDAAGNVVAVPASLGDLNITWGSGWYKHTDGYYYYTSVVPAGGETTNLIESAKVMTENGYQMDLQILAQAIQAEGVNSDEMKAVVDAWGVDPTKLN